MKCSRHGVAYRQVAGRFTCPDCDEEKRAKALALMEQMKGVAPKLPPADEG